MKPTKEQTSFALSEIDRLLAKANSLRESLNLNEVSELIDKLQKNYEIAEAGIMLYGKATDCPELLNSNLN